MKELVRLRTRPSRNGKSFAFLLDYSDCEGNRKRISLGHADLRKAERQKEQKKRELLMGFDMPEPMRLSKYWQDSKARSKNQIRQSTLDEQDLAVRQLINTIGDINYQSVNHKHGEQFIQACLDAGNAMATARKKIKALKRVFELAVQRGQLESNPFKYLGYGRIQQQEIHIYTEHERHSLLKAARDTDTEKGTDWELKIELCLCTAMRRGEILNTVWRDIDFERQVIKVSPKKDTKETWAWFIKDAERRTLPLTDEVTDLLLRHHESQPEGAVYVFVPERRYERIQERRKKNDWSERAGRCPINNFTRKFGRILERANIDQGTFHDLRRTCLSQWFANGLAEFDVMKLAGHSDFATTHRFYLAVREDLIERARVASEAAMNGDSGARLARAPYQAAEKEKAAKHKRSAATHLRKRAWRDSNPQLPVP